MLLFWYSMLDLSFSLLYLFSIAHGLAPMESQMPSRTHEALEVIAIALGGLMVVAALITIGVAS
jgi:hypothetical protein